MCNLLNKMLLCLPHSLAPTHHWERTHAYFSSVSARSECNLSWLHAEAKSALCSISALRPSLSFSPEKKKKACPSLLFTARRGELRIQTHRFASQKTSMKTIPRLFAHSVCCLKVRINCRSIYTNERSETLEDKRIWELTWLEQTNCNSKFSFFHLVKFLINNKKKGSLFSKQRCLIGFKARKYDVLLVL